jgi:hypothetical protein
MRAGVSRALWGPHDGSVQRSPRYFECCFSDFCCEKKALGIPGMGVWGGVVGVWGGVVGVRGDSIYTVTRQYVCSYERVYHGLLQATGRRTGDGEGVARVLALHGDCFPHGELCEHVLRRCCERLVSVNTLHAHGQRAWSAQGRVAFCVHARGGGAFAAAFMASNACIVGKDEEVHAGTINATMELRLSDEVQDGHVVLGTPYHNDGHSLTS